MSVLTVPRSIASSFLKNFSINFTATVPPPYWQVPWKRVSFQSATRMPELRPVISWGMSFENNKQLLTGGFQPPYDICAGLDKNVRLRRGQVDGTTDEHR